MIYRGPHFCHRAKFVRNFTLLFRLSNLDLLENPDVLAAFVIDQQDSFVALTNFVKQVESFDVDAIQKQRTHTLRKSSIFDKQTSFKRSRIDSQQNFNEVRTPNLVSLKETFRDALSSKNNNRESSRISYDPIAFTQQLEDCKDIEYFNYDEMMSSALEMAPKKTDRKNVLTLEKNPGFRKQSQQCSFNHGLLYSL